jgi:hypothetical protein
MTQEKEQELELPDTNPGGSLLASSPKRDGFNSHKVSSADT